MPHDKPHHEDNPHLDTITWLEELADHIGAEFKRHTPNDSALPGTLGGILTRAKDLIIEELAEATMHLQLNACACDPSNFRPNVVLGLRHERIGFLANPQPAPHRWASVDREVNYTLMRHTKDTWSPEGTVRLGVTLHRVWKRTQIPVAYFLRIVEHRLTTAYMHSHNLRLRTLLSKLRPLTIEVINATSQEPQ